MKLCRNCRTINEDTAVLCARCKMRDQLVDYNPEKTREWQTSMKDKNNVKQLHNVCKNCGTPEYGQGSRCARCNFPLSIKGSDTGRISVQRKIK